MSEQRFTNTFREALWEAHTVWEKMVSDKYFSSASDLPQVGWLNETITLGDIDRFARSDGLIRHDLRLPKPTCARPRDSQGGTPVAHGSVPSLRRIADWM
jgi:hypothetical protein